MTDNLQLVSPLTQNLILSWLVADKVELRKFNFVAYRFSANGKKFAKPLQEPASRALTAPAARPLRSMTAAPSDHNFQRSRAGG